jgi:predicted lipid carrier protein YhbT
VASVKQCRNALEALAKTLDTVDPDVRSKHLPERTVMCRVKDLDVRFIARLDEAGIHDLAQAPDEDPPHADVRVTVSSDDLLALVSREDDFVSAWLHGRVQVSAPVRDMLRLRSVLGL